MMKKKINKTKVLFFIITSVSLNTLATTDSVFCPNELNCSIDKDITSCTYEPPNRGYWTPVEHQGDPAVVIVDKYQLYSVSAPYHSNKHVTNCQYSSVTNHLKQLSIHAKDVANLEANNQAGAFWRIGKTTGYCDSVRATDCPLKEQSAVQIKNSTETDLGLYIDDAKNWKMVIPPSEDLIRLMYDDLGFCVDQNHCTIGIASKYGVIGKIDVDMNNALKISIITPDDYSIYNISQIEDFNTVEIANTNTYPWNYIYIRNILNTNVIVRVNENVIFEKPLEFNERGKAYYHLVYKNCKSFEACRLDLFSSSGMSIGYIVVDMQNEMNILDVKSNRPSEVILSQNASRSIEVKYSNLKKK